MVNVDGCVAAETRCDKQLQLSSRDVAQRVLRPVFRNSLIANALLGL